MGIGTGIFLMAVGAILTYAVHVTIGVVNLALIGEILMGAGLLVFIISMILFLRKRSTMSTKKTGIDPANGQEVTVEKQSAN